MMPIRSVLKKEALSTERRVKISAMRRGKDAHLALLPFVFAFSGVGVDNGPGINRRTGRLTHHARV
jgi:hypothetical protein